MGAVGLRGMTLLYNWGAGPSLAVSQGAQIRVNTVVPGVVETRWISGWKKFTDKHGMLRP